MYPYPYTPPYQPQQAFYPQMQPQQQIVQVNGKASIEALKLPPNSSLLAMDTSAPMVWMCVSDGVGRVTATPYDVSVHKEEEKKEAEETAKKLETIEKKISEIEEKINDKSYDDAKNITRNQYGQVRQQPASSDWKSSYDQPVYEERDGMRQF